MDMQAILTEEDGKTRLFAAENAVNGRRLVTVATALAAMERVTSEHCPTSFAYDAACTALWDYRDLYHARLDDISKLREYCNIVITRLNSLGAGAFPNFTIINDLLKECDKLFNAAAQVGGKEAPPSWRCFHCDEVFTDREEAAEHFGYMEDGAAEATACQLTKDEKGLVGLLRDAWACLRRHHEEDTDLHRALFSLGSKAETDKRAWGDKEYARGLADGRAGLSTFIDPKDWDGDMLKAFSDAAIVPKEGHVDIRVGTGLAAAHALYVEKRGG